MKSLLSKKCSFIFSLLSLSLFVSCGDFFSPDWGTPAKEFFKEYTESAAIMQPEYDAEFPKNRDGIMCIPCTDDHTITFLLRNPQDYTLQPHYEFKNSSLAGTPGTDYTFVQDPDDKSIVRLTFSKEYLRRIDDGDDKDISGIVSFTEPRSGRVFDHYEIKAHANTTPPEILSPCFQLTSPSDGEYVVCFYFPKLFLTESGYTNPLHRDAYQFIVNGRTYYVKSWTSDSPVRIYETYTETETGFDVSDPSGMFTTTAPSGLSALSDDGFVFDPSAAPDGYVAMYYLTGQVPIPDDVRYSFTIRDREGLGVTVATSNKAKQLNPPTIQVSSNQSYIADENTGRYTVRISHDGLCTDGSSCGSVTVHYTATDSNGRKVSGSANGSAAIRLPGGTYTITANVTRDYYLASDPSSVSAVKVVVPAIYYVSGEGRDSGDSLEDEPTGSREDPFRTVQKAITVFTAAVADSSNTDITADSSCEIRLLTDITPPADLADDFFSTNDNSFISIPRRVGAGTIMLTGTFIIKGYNGKRTINAMRSETSSEYGRVIYNDGVDLQLENLTITGGYTCITTYPEEVPTGSDGAGIATVGNLTMTDCSVLNNTALNPTDGGGGIWCYNAILTLTRCTLRGNTAALPETYIDRSEWAGGAIYANNSSSAYYTTLTDCIISQNTGDSALAMSTLYMTGGKVTENIGNDCYGAGIYMSSGVLDGVEISGNHFTNDIDNTLAGGVYVHNSGSGITIKNCTIKQNSAVHGAGIYFNQDSGDDFVIENCTITQNTSVKSKTDPDDESEFAAGIYYESVAGTIILKGVNTITGNALADGTASDIGMPSSAKFKIDGAMGKSRIGVYKLFYGDDTPSLGHPLDFTIDYGVANSAVPPADIFISQNGYGIAYNEDTGEASFAVSGGSLYSALDYRVSVDSSQSELKTVLGKSKTYTFTVRASRKGEDLYYNRQDKKLYLDAQMQNPVNDEKVNWSAALFSGGYKVSDLEVTTSASGSPELSITVPAQSFEDTYTLKVYANYMGITTDSNFTYSVIDPSLIAVDIESVNAAIDAGGPVEVVGRVTQAQLTAISRRIRLGSKNVELDLSSMAGITELTVDFALGGESYAGNTHITSLILPYCLETLGESSLWGLYYLRYLYIPKSVTHIEDSAFFLCATDTGLGIELEEGNEVYDLIDGCIVTKDHKTLVRYANGTATGNITIPACIETIASCAFTGSRFSSITFEEGSRLKTIGMSAFDYCSRLYSVNDLPLSLEKLEEAVWRNCSSLYSITYKGTLNQWNSIEKPDQEKYLIVFVNHDVSVSCSNGYTTIPRW